MISNSFLKADFIYEEEKYEEHSAEILGGIAQPDALNALNMTTF